MAIVSLEGTFNAVNQCLADMLAYTPEELAGSRFASYTHPDDLTIDRDNLRQIRSGEIDFFVREKCYQQRSGETVWMHLTTSRVCTPNGEPGYFLSVIEDITAPGS